MCVYGICFFVFVCVCSVCLYLQDCVSVGLRVHMWSKCFCVYLCEFHVCLCVCVYAMCVGVCVWSVLASGTDCSGHHLVLLDSGVFIRCPPKSPLSRCLPLILPSTCPDPGPTHTHPCYAHTHLAGISIDCMVVVFLPRTFKRYAYATIIRG